MSISEVHDTISRLSIDQERKYRLTFIVGQAYTLEVLHEAFVKNGMNENSSIFYQAARELQEKFLQIADTGKDFGVLAEYFEDLHTIFSSQLNPKEAKVSYLD